MLRLDVTRSRTLCAEKRVSLGRYSARIKSKGTGVFQPVQSPTVSETRSAHPFRFNAPRVVDAKSQMSAQRLMPIGRQPAQESERVRCYSVALQVRLRKQRRDFTSVPKMVGLLAWYSRKCRSRQIFARLTSQNLCQQSKSHQTSNAERVGTAKSSSPAASERVSVGIPTYL